MAGVKCLCYTIFLKKDPQIFKKISLNMYLFGKNVVIFIQTILSFVLSRKMINIYNDIARKYGNVTVEDFRKYEKLEYKKNKLKLDNLVCIRNSLSLNCLMFLIKTIYQFVKDSFVASSTGVIKSSNIFQNSSVYP